MQDVEANDALECEEFEQDLVLLQLCLMLLVEPQTIQNSHGWEDDLQDGEPDVGEVYAVRCFAVRSSCERCDCCDPNDNRGWNELQSAVPHSLQYMLALEIEI